MVKINDILGKDSLGIARGKEVKENLKRFVIELSIYIVFGLLLIFLFDDDSYGTFIIVFGLFEFLTKCFSINRAFEPSPLVAANIEEEFIFDEKFISLNEKSGDDFEEHEKIPYCFISQIQKINGAYFIYQYFSELKIIQVKDITEGSEEELDAIFISALGKKFVIK